MHTVQSIPYQFEPSGILKRLGIVVFGNRFKIQLCLLEPVGSVAPKVNQADELSSARVKMNESLSIATNVQGYPVPSFL